MSVICLFWNNIDLKPPPIKSYAVLTKSQKSTSLGLALALDKALAVLENQKSLHKESALLSRIVYRFKRKLRNDKGFKTLEKELERLIESIMNKQFAIERPVGLLFGPGWKINKSLRHYLTLDLHSTLTTLRRNTYENNGPSRSMLEWGLTRIIGFAALFDRVYSTCLEAAGHMNIRIKTGHYWNMAMICIGIMGRIRTVSIFLMISCIEWYQCLLAYSSCLAFDVEWLPRDCKLPDDLRSWLGNPSYLKVKIQFEGDTSEKNNSSPLLKVKEEIVVPYTGDGLLFNEDLGEVLSRDGFNIERKEDLPNYDFLNEITSVKKLATFMKRENLLRKSNMSSALTKHVDVKKWKEIKVYVLNSLSTLYKLKDSDSVNNTLKDVRNNLKRLF